MLTRTGFAWRRFNVGTFGGEIQYWQADLTMATKDILASLGDWLSSIHCHGNTRLLEAIQVGHSVPPVLTSQHHPTHTPPPDQVTVDRFPTCSLHVVSDGGVDHSEEFFFKRLLSLPPPAVHTTAFRCTDRWAWSTRCCTNCMGIKILCSFSTCTFTLHLHLLSPPAPSFSTCCIPSQLFRGHCSFLKELAERTSGRCERPSQ